MTCLMGRLARLTHLYPALDRVATVFEVQFVRVRSTCTEQEHARVGIALRSIDPYASTSCDSTTTDPPLAWNCL